MPTCAAWHWDPAVRRKRPGENLRRPCLGKAWSRALLKAHEWFAMGPGGWIGERLRLRRWRPEWVANDAGSDFFTSDDTGLEALMNQPGACVLVLAASCFTYQSTAAADITVASALAFRPILSELAPSSVAVV